MIRFRLLELMANYQYEHGRKLTFDEIAESTNIHRATLSKIANQRNAQTRTENIDRLCKFFKCQVGDLMEYVEEDLDHKS